MTEGFSSSDLQALTGRIFEEAAFIMTEPAGDRPPWDGEEIVVAELAFHGTRSGRVRLASSLTLARQLAANLLGVEPEDALAESSCNGAVGEMLNILAGALMEALFGAKMLCGIGIPDSRQQQAEEHEAALAKADLAVHLLAEDEFRLDVVLTYDA